MCGTAIREEPSDRLIAHYRASQGGQPRRTQLCHRRRGRHHPAACRHGLDFLQAGGERISDPASAAASTRWSIPPAWTDVWICPDPDGHIQATARDARGRKQYRYHPRYREARDQSKFRRMLEFSEVLPPFASASSATCARPEPSRAPDARHGGAAARQDADPRRQRRVRAREPLLRPDDAAQAARAGQGRQLRFSFRGKSGVEHSISVTDLRLARIMQRCQDLPGQEMFQYLDGGRRSARRSPRTTSTPTCARSRERDVTAKDFRTWGGTMLAAVELRAMGPARTAREADRNIMRAIDAVPSAWATRAVCRKYYVHPALLHAYLQGLVPGPVPARDAPLQNRRRAAHCGAAARRGGDPAISAGGPVNCLVVHSIVRCRWIETTGRPTPDDFMITVKQMMRPAQSLRRHAERFDAAWFSP